MDLSPVMTAISTVGFPIVCVIFMAFYVKYITDKHREEITRLNAQHREEMSEVTTAINNNTLALQQLSDFFIRERTSQNG